ncbi:MAG: DUF2877 domain-containing protein [bacterium]
MKRKKILHSRTDSLFPEIVKKSGKISAVFNSSFDILLDNFLVNCTSKKETLHPLSLLTVPGIIDSAQKNSPVEFSFPFIKIAGKKFEIKADIAPPAAQPVNRSHLSANIRRLKQSLQINGVDSLLNKNTSGGLNGAVQLFRRKLEHPPLQADDFIEFFGAGEGLTPTWDDFFAGALLADRITGNNIIFTGEMFFNRLKNKTTRTSYWQLKFANTGKFAWQFEQLIHRLRCRKTTAADFITPLSSGHSSGTDICQGIIEAFNHFSEKI